MCLFGKVVETKLALWVEGARGCLDFYVYGEMWGVANCNRVLLHMANGEEVLRGIFFSEGGAAGSLS